MEVLRHVNAVSISFIMTAFVARRFGLFPKQAGGYIHKYNDIFALHAQVLQLLPIRPFYTISPTRICLLIACDFPDLSRNASYILSQSKL